MTPWWYGIYYGGWNERYSAIKFVTWAEHHHIEMITIRRRGNVQ